MAVLQLRRFIMARYPLGPYARKRTQGGKWLYIVLAVLIAGVAIAGIFRFNPFSKEKPDETLTDITQQQETESGTAGLEIDNEPAEEIAEPDAKSIPVEKEPNLVTIPQPAVETDPRAASLIAEAADCINAKPARIIEARSKLNEALAFTMNAEQQKIVKDQLSALADEWLFSRKIFPSDPLCSSYTVRPGEILSDIGDKYKVPYKILMQINNIPRPEALQAAQTIKVINGPFHATVHLSSFTMDIYLQNTFVRSFRVGIGQPGLETPTGLWRVRKGGKLIEPPWKHPVTGKILHPGDPEYALGSRWIGLEGIDENTKGRDGFGIHGTKDPETIGDASSRGCIRLHNGDVIFVYDLLVPVDSRVKVVD
jgi:lipoprotein-anchoring transpeptidase ErfK/SrfK